MPSSHPASYPPPRRIGRRDVMRLGALAATGAAAGSALGATGTASASPGRPVAPAGASSRSALERQVAMAAAEHGVPADVLLAMAWVNTRGRMPAPRESTYEQGSPSGRGVYGPAALVRNPFSDTLGEAARLTGIPARALMTDRAANLRGGAALLAASMPKRQRRASGANPEAALDGIAGTSGGEIYAGQVRQALAQRAWQRDVTTVRPGSAPADDLAAPRTAAAAKPPVTWYPAHPNNFTSANRPASNPINTIVIHVTQGSWSSALNWFQNPNARVSAHYTVRSSDGRIGQSLSDINIGWHAGNWSVNQTSIGIEHEGYVDDPSWFTPELFDGSARMAGYLCRRYGIPVNRSHIIGHNEVPGASHTDPGQWWWWSYYMDRVRRYA